MRDKQCDFLEFVEKFLSAKLFLIAQKIAKRELIQGKNVEKIYIARDNYINFTCFCIFKKNYFLTSKHLELHFIMFL